MKIKSDFVKTQVGDDTFVIVPVGETGEKMHCVIELNETAAQVYDGIEKGLTEQAIAAELAAEYGIAMEKAEQDTKAVREKLTAAGVLE